MHFLYCNTDIEVFRLRPLMLIELSWSTMMTMTIYQRISAACRCCYFSPWLIICEVILIAIMFGWISVRF